MNSIGGPENCLNHRAVAIVCLVNEITARAVSRNPGERIPVA
jgi:hypothetical protein